METSILSINEISLIETLKDSGYAEISNNGQSVVLSKPSNSALVKELASNSIVIGRGALSTSTILPWMSYGVTWNINEIDSEYLDNFDLILLYDFRFSDVLELEHSIRKWVAAGKTIVLDLTSMTQPILFGVEAGNIEVDGIPQFIPGEAADFQIDNVAEEPFEYQGNPWRGVAYQGLDGVLLNVIDATGKSSSIFGYSELPEGRVYYLGLNWIAHINDTEDQIALDFLKDFFQRASPSHKTVGNDLPITLKDPPSDNWGFLYSIEEDKTVLVSETWSPHWSVSLDGEPFQLYNHENLMLLHLPSGSHIVEFQYRMTLIQWIGLAITAVSLLLFIFILRHYSAIKSSISKRVFKAENE